MITKYNSKLTNVARILRKNMTKEEKHLWYDFLKDYPIRIKRQEIISGYIVDFYCSQARIAIELDGSQHYFDLNIEKDKIRTDFLNDYGLTVIRIANDQVMKNFDGVCQYIDETIRGILRK